jgi:flagellar hook-associated protein FlgK
LDAFWTGWQALSSDPSNTALRQDLVERSVALTQGINQGRSHIGPARNMTWLCQSGPMR